MHTKVLLFFALLFTQSICYAEKNPWNQQLDLVADVKISTLGIGGSVAWEYNEFLDIRFETFMLGMGYETGLNALDYEIDLSWRSYGLVLNFYPGRRNFHINTGVFLTNNNLDIQVSGQTSYFINGNEYAAASVGDITTSLSFDSPAYYLGVGWDNVFARYPNFGINFDLGIVFQGAPKVELSSSAGAANTELNDDLQNEEDALATHLELFRFYPVISLGLSYRFSFPN